ncbi:UNKNOWN [Stylonychia lemnae]|uniref:Uncharacterized protein n=1 Tax=Stylonychia lemnae TaxID=5949 RepID=A0A078A3E5_STYLE|nr:UNKNOWN [Stylonychia lemnae]|eukprot:CDW75284.1 UNKNOWN [Stylonychia lemnae]
MNALSNSTLNEDFQVINIKKDLPQNMSPQKRQQSKDMKSIFEGLGNKELDWFSFENRIRTLVILLLDPMQKKMRLRNKRYYGMNQIYLGKEWMRQTLSRKRHRGERRMLESKVYQEITKILNAQDVLREKQRATYHQIDSFNKIIDHMMDEFQKMKQSFHESREQYGSLYNQLHQDFSNRVTQMYQQISKVDEVRNLYERQIEIYKEDLKRFDLKVEKFNRDLEKESFKSSQLIEQTEDYVKAQVNNVFKEMQSLRDNQVSQEKEFRTLDFYLDKIQPLKTFAQTCEVLQDVITYEREFNKLINYEQKRLPQFEQEIQATTINGYTFDKTAFQIPQIPAMKEEKKRYAIQKSMKGLHKDLLSQRDHRSMSRSPSQVSQFAQSGIFKQSLHSGNHLNGPQTPNVRTKRPLSNKGKMTMEFNQKSHSLLGSQANHSFQFGQNTGSGSNMKLTPNQIEFLTQILVHYNQMRPHETQTVLKTLNLSGQRQHSNTNFTPDGLNQLEKASPMIFNNENASEGLQTDDEFKNQNSRDQAKALTINNANKGVPSINIEKMDKSKESIQKSTIRRRDTIKLAKRASVKYDQPPLQQNKIDVSEFQKQSSLKRNSVIHKRRPNMARDELLGLQEPSRNSEKKGKSTKRQSQQSVLSLTVQKVELEGINNVKIEGSGRGSSGLDKPSKDFSYNDSFQDKKNLGQLSKMNRVSINEINAPSVDKIDQQQYDANLDNSQNIFEGQQNYFGNGNQQPLYLEELKEKESEELESPLPRERRRKQLQDYDSRLDLGNSESSQSYSDDDEDNEDSSSGNEVILTESELFNKFKEFRKNIQDDDKAMISELCQDIAKSFLKENLETVEEKINTIMDKLNNEMGARFKKIEEVTDRLDDNAFRLMDQYNLDLKKKRREKREYQLDFKEVSSRLSNQDEMTRGLKNDVENLRMALVAVDQTLNIQLALDVQEEKDKEQVGLYGMSNEEFHDKSMIAGNNTFATNSTMGNAIQNNINMAKEGKVMSLNTNCVSCSGNSSFVIKAFKMACLAYKPSKVQFRNKLYDRKDLLMKKAQILQRDTSNIEEILNSQRSQKTQQQQNQEILEQKASILKEMVSTTHDSRQQNRTLTGRTGLAGFTGGQSSVSSNRLNQTFSQSFSAYNNQYVGRNAQSRQISQRVYVQDQSTMLNQSMTSVKHGGVDLTHNPANMLNTETQLTDREGHSQIPDLTVQGQTAAQNQSYISAQPLQQSLSKYSTGGNQIGRFSVHEKTQNLVAASKDNIYCIRNNTPQPQTSIIGIQQQHHIDMTTQGILNQNKQKYAKNFKEQQINDMKKQKQKIQRRLMNLSATGVISNQYRTRPTTTNDGVGSSGDYPYQMGTHTQGYMQSLLKERKSSNLNVNLAQHLNQVTANLVDMTQTPNSVSSQSIGYLKYKKQTPHQRSKSILQINNDSLVRNGNIAGGQIAQCALQDTNLGQGGQIMSQSVLHMSSKNLQ